MDEEGVVFWCDQGLNKIERVELTPRVNRTVVVRDNFTEDCRGLAVHGKYIYWTDVYVFSSKFVLFSSIFRNSYLK